MSIAPCHPPCGRWIWPCSGPNWITCSRWRSGEIYGCEPICDAPDELRRLNDVAFSGDGEPTASPLFGDACRIAVELLQKHALSARIVVITNATLLHRPKVAEAMLFLDQHDGEIWAKLDAGTELYYRQVERTTIPLNRVIENIAAAGRIRPIVIQSFFMKINGLGPSGEEIAAYVGRLRELVEMGCRIKLVQVYSVARGRPRASSSRWRIRSSKP